MSNRENGWSRRPIFWALCGVALGLVLVLGRWWALGAEGKELEAEVRRFQSEYQELEPIVGEVKGLKGRQQRLQSLIGDLVQRHRLFQVAAAVLEAPEPGGVVESMDAREDEVEILARADDEAAVRGLIRALEATGGFRQDGVDAAPDDAPGTRRFVVRGELGPAETGEGEE